MRGIPVTWQRWSHRSIRRCRKPHAAHADFMTLVFYRTVTVDQSFRLRDCRGLNHFCFCDLGLGWSGDLHIRTWPVSHRDIPDVWKWTSYTSRLPTDIVLQKIQTDRQTDSHTSALEILYNIYRVINNWKNKATVFAAESYNTKVLINNIVFFVDL